MVQEETGCAPRTSSVTADRDLPTVWLLSSNGGSVAKFITIGYGDEQGYERTDPSVRDAAHAHDAALKARGALIGIADVPVQVRNHDGAGTRTIAGPFMQSSLPIAGFAVIEADDLEEAIRIVAKTPCAVAQGVVEVWPLREMP
jgi:hypothetical protein